MAGELSVGTLSGRIELEDKLTPAIAQVSDKVTELEKGFGLLHTGVLEIAEGFGLGELAVDALKEAFHFLIEEFGLLTIHGSVVQDITTNYERLTSQVGLLSEELLGDLKTATHGTIDDFQLMKRVNEDLAANANLTAEQFTLLAKGAFALSKAEGIDVVEAMDKMNQAMITGRVRGIAMLTGKIDLIAAEERFAEANHHSVDELTAEGKLQATREGIILKVGEALGRVGEQTESLKNLVEKSKAEWANFEDEMDRVVSGSVVLRTGFVTLKAGLVAAFGPDQAVLIQNIKGGIDNTAIGMTYLGIAAVETVRTVHVVWSAFETIVNTVALAIVGTATAVVEAVVAAERAAGAMHLVPQSEVEAARQTAQFMRDLTSDIAANMVESAKGIVMNSALDESFDKLNAVLGNTKAAMLNAKMEEIAATEATKNHTAELKPLAGVYAGIPQSLEQVNNYFRTSKAELKAYADAWVTLNSIGETYLDTVARIRPEILQQIEYYLKAGASVSVLAKAYPELTEAQVKAVDEMVKQDLRIDAELTKANDEYYKAVNAASHDSVAKQIDDVYITAQAKIDAMTKAKNYSLEAEMVIWKTAEQTAENMKQKEIESDVHSRSHYKLLADLAEEAFQKATNAGNEYTTEWIADLRKAADEARKAYDTFGQVAPAIDAATMATSAWDKSMQAVGGTLVLVATDLADMNSKLSDFYDQFRGVGTPGDSAFGANTFAMGQGVGGLGVRGIGHRAGGGPVAAGEAVVVGENRPELWVPDRAGMIIPNVGGEPITVNLVVDGRILASVVTNHQTRTAKQGRQFPSA